MQAATRLTAQLKWQREERPGEQACSSCARDPRSHYFHPVGYTKCGQPVLYSCLALASDRGPASNREHMIATFEQAIRLMPAGVEKWVWFSDLRGFGMRDLNPVRHSRHVRGSLQACRQRATLCSTVHESQPVSDTSSLPAA